MLELLVFTLAIVAEPGTAEIIIAELQRNNQRIYRAYLLRESFQQIYEAANVRAVDDLFDEWFRRARRSRLDPFKKLAWTMADHWMKIRRFLEVRLTNGIVEGTNSKIRMITHRDSDFTLRPLSLR